MTVVATNRQALIQALISKGFLLVADLPGHVRINERQKP